MAAFQGSPHPWPLTTRPMLRRIGRTDTPPRARAKSAMPEGAVY